MATASSITTIPLQTGDLDPAYFTLAAHERDGQRQIWSTCSNPGQLRNQTFLTTLQGDVIRAMPTPVERRDGVIITSLCVNPGAARNEIWRMTRDSVAPFATCGLEVCDLATRSVTQLGSRSPASDFASFAFTQNRAYALATFDGLKISCFEAASLREVDDPAPVAGGQEPALIWAPAHYRGADPDVWQANRKQAVGLFQGIAARQPLTGALQKQVENFMPPPAAQPAVIWVGQDPRASALWALSGPSPQPDGAIQIIRVVTQGAVGWRLVQVPFANYGGAISPCANPVTGALQFIDPATGDVIAVDVNAATATRLAQSPIDPYGAAMCCDNAGATWVLGNHPQRGPMLWGHARG
ncbi:hypothetical protein ACERNI_11275 [Camelimonas sp. ID_303_24]